MVEALKEVWKFTMGCPVTQMVATVLGVIVGLALLNMALVAAGFVVIPVLIKLVGGLIGLYFAFDYMKETVIKIYKEIKIFLVACCPNPASFWCSKRERGLSDTPCYLSRFDICKIAMVAIDECLLG